MKRTRGVGAVSIRPVLLAAIAGLACLVLVVTHLDNSLRIGYNLHVPGRTQVGVFSYPQPICPSASTSAVLPGTPISTGAFCWGAEMAYRPDQYVTKTCEVCGGEFSCTPWHAKVRRYCGNKCSAVARWQVREKAPRTEFTCAQCGKVFERSQSYIADCARKGHSCGVYCSARCKYDAMVVGPHRFTCENCGKTFTRKQPNNSVGDPHRFCSLACFHESNRKTITRACLACGQEFTTTPSEDRKYCDRECLRADGGSVEITCKVCGKTVTRKRSYMARGTTGIGNFCSKQCQGLAQRGENSPNWKGGIADDRSLWWAKEGKSWIAKCIARDNYTCQICGQRGVVGRNKLEVHHKASWTKYPALRTHPDNGITLCARCHRGRGVGIHSRSRNALKKQWEAEAVATLTAVCEVA